MLFSEIQVSDIFFEGITGEYFIKKSETSSLVYDIKWLRVYTTGDDGGVIEYEFPDDHEVEELGD